MPGGQLYDHMYSGWGLVLKPKDGVGPWTKALRYCDWDLTKVCSKPDPSLVGGG